MDIEMKMQVSLSGPGVNVSPGDLIHCDPKQSVRFADAGYAVATDPEAFKAMKAELGFNVDDQNQSDADKGDKQESGEGSGKPGLDADLDAVGAHQEIDAIIAAEEGFKLAEGITLMAAKVEAVRAFRVAARADAATEAAKNA